MISLKLLLFQQGRKCAGRASVSYTHLDVYKRQAYSLGAAGEAGVTKALQILHKELDVTMAFCGHTNIQTVDRNILLPGTLPG